jgi:dTDP-4-amino-4,6-dideoxy-D-galactose acyltransferase
MSEPCQFLPWDSQFFGVRIARVVTGRLTPPVVEQILSWCRQNQIECLYFLADSDHAETVDLAEVHGFHLADIRLTLQRDLQTWEEPSPASPRFQIRPCQSEHLATLQAIARHSYRLSRFYFDSHFPRSACDQLYETWIKNSCEGYADLVWVAEQDRQPVGFITCHLPEEAENPAAGQIGLVGVAEAARGGGLGQWLVNQALGWFHSQGVTQVQVVTQGRNLAAQRLYQRCGFVPHNLQLWYHKWFR